MNTLIWNILLIVALITWAFPVVLAKSNTKLHTQDQLRNIDKEHQSKAG